MKITPVQFQILLVACRQIKDKYPHITPQSYVDNKIGKDHAVRFRWDLFHSARKFVSDTTWLSSLLDAHIDTAMRRIVSILYPN